MDNEKRLAALALLRNFTAAHMPEQMFYIFDLLLCNATPEQQKAYLQDLAVRGLFHAGN